MICGALGQTSLTTPSLVGPDPNNADLGPQFGGTLAAGDFDYDGKRDVAVATFEEDSELYEDNHGLGVVRVYEYDAGTWTLMSAPVGFPGGTPPEETYFGYAMCAGNVDGDANDELIISAPGGDGALATNYGAVYIYDYDANQSPAWILKHKFESHSSYGGQLGDNFGWSVALCDVNGDNDNDLIVGARYWSVCEEADDCPINTMSDSLEDWTGRAYVYDHDGFESSATWREVNECSLVIRGEAGWGEDGGDQEQTRGYFGTDVASVGDVNDDGYEDFIISAPRRTASDFAGSCTATNFAWVNPNSSPPNETVYESFDDDCRVGKVYLFAGVSSFPGYSAYDTEQENWGEDAETYAKLVFQGESTEDKFGNTVASGGDLNADGINEVVISSWFHHQSGSDEIGRVYVFLMSDYSGGWPGNSDDKHWDGSEANIIIDGPSDATGPVHFGRSLACNGNMNKGTNARADLLVGAPRKNSCPGYPSSIRDDRGAVYLFQYAGSLGVGENGGHTSINYSNNAYWFEISCTSGYEKYSPLLGNDVLFVGDADNDSPNHNDDFVIGCRGWDTTVYDDPADDWGAIYLRTY